MVQAWVFAVILALTMKCSIKGSNLCCVKVKGTELGFKKGKFCIRNGSFEVYALLAFLHIETCRYVLLIMEVLLLSVSFVHLAVINGILIFHSVLHRNQEKHKRTYPECNR